MSSGVPKTTFKVAEPVDFSRMRICFLIEKPNLLKDNPQTEYVKIPHEQIAIWKKEDKYELVRGENMLSEAILENWELLEAGKEVTVAFPLRKLQTPQTTTIGSLSKPVKTSKFKLPTKTSSAIAVQSSLRGLKSVTDSIKTLRAKAIDQRKKEIK